MTLKDRIKNSGLTITYISKELRISRRAFYNKLYGISSFNVFEVVKLSHLLGVSVQTITEEALNERH